MPVCLVSALVSQLVLVYVSVPVSVVCGCSSWWYVFVSVSGGFWHFSLLCTGLPPYDDDDNDNDNDNDTDNNNNK